MKKIISHNDPLFKGWVENVQDLKHSRLNLNRIINRVLKTSRPYDSKEISSNDLELIKYLSKSYFIIYSSYTEAVLLKLLHLPNSYTCNEVTNILTLKRKNVISAWLKAIKLALEKNTLAVDGGITKEDCNNKLKDITTKYLKEPSHLRNKLVHGQWSKAFNGQLTNRDDLITIKISEIDYVKIDVWFRIFKMFEELLTQLIQSPNKGFPAQYYALIEKIESFAIKSLEWNMQSKKYELISKGPTNCLTNQNR